jgi:hypothetical protein
MSFLAVLVCILLLLLLLPPFNTLVEKKLLLGLSHPLHILALLSIVVVCGLVAGSYPALYLSSFNPVTVFKGLKIKGGSASVIRKGLVILQFTISIVLIISTIIIYQQIQHVVYYLHRPYHQHHYYLPADTTCKESRIRI